MSFIDILPMNSNAAADKSPLRALLRCGTKKAREPFQRRGDFAAVDKRDDQLVVGAGDDRVGDGLTN
ncbi:hypothetical protein BH18VER1_BH18VER1_22790 [soil metagenome]